MIINKIKRLVWVAVLCLVSIAAQAQNNTHQSINDVLRQTAGKEMSLLYQIPEEETVPAIFISGNVAYRLKTVVHKVNESKQDIFAENLDNIYPGAIVYADQDLANGNPTLVGLDYGAVTIRVDFNTGRGNSASVSGVKNSADAIQAALYSILQSSDYKPPVKLNYKKTYVSSVAEMAVNLGVNVSFLEAKANVQTSITNNQSSITEVEDYSQQYYTASITWEVDKSKYFGTNVSGQDVLEKMNQAPLAIITSVTYGRRAYCFKDYASSVFTFLDNDTLSIFGQTAITAQSIAENSKENKKWMWVSGSDPVSSAMMLNGSDIDTAMSKSLIIDAEANPGTPLYYTVRYLDSGKTAKVTTTGKYTTVEYMPMPHMVTCTFRNNAKHFLGAKLKMRIDYNAEKFERTDGGNGEFVQVEVPKDSCAMDGFLRCIEHEISFKGSKTFPLDLGVGLYLAGPIRLQIQCRKFFWGKWHDDVVGFIYPDDGEIGIDVSGHVGLSGKTTYIDEKSKTQLLTY